MKLKIFKWIKKKSLFIQGFLECLIYFKLGWSMKDIKFLVN